MPLKIKYEMQIEKILEFVPSLPLFDFSTDVKRK
jgi:hypothetical protein